MKTATPYEFDTHGGRTLKVLLVIDGHKLAHILTSRAVQKGKKHATICNGAVKLQVVSE